MHTHTNDTLSTIQDCLKRVYHAQEQERRIQSEHAAALSRLAELLGRALDSQSSINTQLVQEAEALAAQSILQAEPDRDLLSALQAVYAIGKRHGEALDQLLKAMDRLRCALRALPAPPSQRAMDSQDDVIAAAERIVCQEWLARQRITDEEAGHE